MHQRGVRHAPLRPLVLAVKAETASLLSEVYRSVIRHTLSAGATAILCLRFGEPIYMILAAFLAILLAGLEAVRCYGLSLFNVEHHRLRALIESRNNPRT